MTTIITKNAFTIGTSDDGRITYQDNWNGPTIDGRQAWRGYFLKAPELRTIADGSVDMTAQVNPADWAAACKVMSDVWEAAQIRQDMARRAAEERLEKMANAVPDAMRDFFRDDSDL